MFKLTNSIFVRCDQSRVDVMKAIIMGSAGTPYAHVKTIRKKIYLLFVFYVFRVLLSTIYFLMRIIQKGLRKLI
jgi:hypothetical protein